LQLVRRNVLRFERQGLGEVACEVGGLLARDAVDEIERNVVNSGITHNLHGPADVIRPRAALQHVQKVRVERLCANRHTIDTLP